MKNNKSLGQHWLKDRFILDEIADLAAETDLDSNRPTTDFCLEIGPGLGTLTSSLLRRFPKVEAVEFDKNLADNLPKSFPGKNLIIHNEDFLKFDLSLINEPYVVAGNIPYYITSPIIFKLISATNRPRRIVLLIQKEVADRIVATEGNHTVLSLSVQNYAKASLGPVVKKDLFTPPPKVDSEVIVLEPRLESLVPETVLNTVKIGFSSPRKKLSANLSFGFKLPREDILNFFTKNNIDTNARPSDLTLKDWEKLDNFIHKR